MGKKDENGTGRKGVFRSEDMGPVEGNKDRRWEIKLGGNKWLVLLKKRHLLKNKWKVCDEDESSLLPQSYSIFRFLQLLAEKESIIYILGYFKRQIYNSKVSASIDSLTVCVCYWLCGLACSKPHCATPHIRSNNLLLCQYSALYAEWWKRGLGASARTGDGGMYFTDLNRVWESGEPQMWGQLQPILTLLSSVTLDLLARSQ